MTLSQSGIGTATQPLALHRCECRWTVSALALSAAIGALSRSRRRCTSQRHRSTSSSPRRPTCTATSRGWDYYANAPDTLRGLSRVATIVDSLRRVSPARCRSLVDAGDILQGNPLTYVAARIDTTMPQPGDRGDERHASTTRRVDRQSRVQLRAADARPRDARRPTFRCSRRTCTRPNGKRRFRRWAVSTRRGVKIAIIGATTPGSMVWDRDNLAGSVDVRDIIPDVRERGSRRARRRRRRRHRRRCTPGSTSRRATIPSATGVGERERRRARSRTKCPGIDLIVYGHSHKEMADTVIGRHAAHAAEELGDERRGRASAARAAQRPLARHLRSTAASSRPRTIARIRRSSR